jgi:hypothetical protein
MDIPFQAHLALESILDFRLISGLENADRVGFACFSDNDV